MLTRYCAPFTIILYIWYMGRFKLVSFADYTKEEIWLYISGYEGIYSISNYGRVKNNRTGLILKPVRQSKGYYQVFLSVKNKSVHRFIHRLVAEAFLQNTNNYPQINHKDENKANNCWWNLEWCSAQYNTVYGTGLKRGMETKAKKYGYFYK